MSPDEVIRAVTTGNVIMPSGSVNIGDETRITPMNSVVPNINDLLELPIRSGAGPTVFLRDVGSVSDSTDIPTAYALVNGRRAVYIPVTKRPDASTLNVVSEVKANLARFQALVPDDIKVSYELDQSRTCPPRSRRCVREAVLGAMLTGLMVLLFLRDWRSSAIVVVTIPFALLAAVVALWGAGQTINIMTLGGLALAVGILVDEATVAIENIHTHLARGAPVARGVFDASREVVVPRLLAMLSVVAVFVPSFFMTGVSRSLFVPLSLAVGFAMMASFLLSSSLVPVLSVWFLGAAWPTPARERDDWVDRLRDRLGGSCGDWRRRGLVLVAAYLVVTIGVVIARRPAPGPRDLSGERRQAVPAAVSRAGRHEVRDTERLADDVLDEIKRAAGRTTSKSRSAMSACSPRLSDQHDLSVDRRIARRRAAGGAQAGRAHPLADFEETLRGTIRRTFPAAQFSFEPGDIVSRIMNFGAPTPVEVAVSGPDFAATPRVRREAARRTRAE